MATLGDSFICVASLKVAKVSRGDVIMPQNLGHFIAKNF
jgi:hypothetical protein